MSIASELTRLQNAKAAIKQSLENKGATIDSSATLSDYPSIIDNLPSGGDNSEIINILEGNNTDYHIPAGVTKLSPIRDFNITVNNIYYPSGIKSKTDKFNPTVNSGVYFNSLEDFLDINLVEGDYLHTLLGKTVTLYINNTPTYDIIVPEGYTSIGAYKFYQYLKLKSILLSSTVTSLGNYCFSKGNTADNNYMGLDSINLDNITSYGRDCLRGCNKLTGKLDLSKATSIGYGAFMYTGYSEVVLPTTSNYSSIGTSTFSYMPNLRSITIPTNITLINDYAFEGDYNWKNGEGLTSLTIPSSVTKIGYMAFGYQQSLQSITIEATTPPTLSSNAFLNTNNFPIYVPCESVQAYKTATNWSAYADRITCAGGADEPNNTVKLVQGGCYGGGAESTFTYDLDGSGVNYTLTGFEIANEPYYIKVTSTIDTYTLKSLVSLNFEEEPTIKAGDTVTLIDMPYEVQGTDIDTWNGRGIYFGFYIDSGVTTLKVTIDTTNNTYTLKAL